MESQKVALEDVESDIKRQVVETFNGPSDELHGRVRKLMRLYKKQKRLLAQQGHPHIHFGKKLYQDQEAKGWKRAYAEARNDRIGCMGSSDETGGNSTLRLEPVYEDGKLQFELWHAKELMGFFTLKPKEQVKEICQQGKRKGQWVNRKVTVGRIPLTIWLIHHENGHWYIHISFFRNKTQPDYVPLGAIGVDLNCDSMADSWVQMADGTTKPIEQVRIGDFVWSRNPNTGVTEAGISSVASGGFGPSWEPCSGSCHIGRFERRLNAGAWNRVSFSGM